MNNRAHNFESSVRASHASRDVATGNDERGVSSSQAARGTQPGHHSAGETPALPGNPVTQPIYDFICGADAHQLQHAMRVLIPHCKGITTEERDQLEAAVDQQFSRLNSLSLKPFSQGRRSLLSLHTQEEATLKNS